MNKIDKKADLLRKLLIIREVKYPMLKDLAEACGVSSAAITGWIKSGRIDYLEHSDSIAGLIKLSIDELHDLNIYDFKNHLLHLKDPNFEPFKDECKVQEAGALYSAYDSFLVECAKFVVRLPGSKSLTESQLNDVIENVYNDGFETKKINPELISHLM